MDVPQGLLVMVKVKRALVTNGNLNTLKNSRFFWLAIALFVGSILKIYQNGM
jgi:hypothetical protein